MTERLAAIEDRLGALHIMLRGAEQVSEAEADPILTEIRALEDEQSEREFREQVFEYLDALRESGVTNMFGAGPYLTDEFGMSSKEARQFVGEWMRTFGERHPR